ncbi:cytochrome c oxidase subunit NDUFA4-like [Phyllostomus discolor]|uniref:Cytochrome c oxidase subunit NDUFA4 n=1 Tax=Phyllostomus discolor TaxID=89673 RepID=A0A7E6DT05_9CHIR|nr:cytochrome c oxidase subunit NDUFA4-like [Phyllostomus discolor]
MLCQILSQAKKYSSLIPLFVRIGAGDTGTVLYVTRLALSTHLVSMGTKRIIQKPQNKQSPNEQYKFHSVNADYSKLKKEGPDF